MLHRGGCWWRHSGTLNRPLRFFRGGPANIQRRRASFFTRSTVFHHISELAKLPRLPVLIHFFTPDSCVAVRRLIRNKGTCVALRISTSISARSFFPIAWAR